MRQPKTNWFTTSCISNNLYSRRDSNSHKCLHPECSRSPITVLLWVGYRIRTDVAGFADLCLSHSANPTYYVVRGRVELPTHGFSLKILDLNQTKFQILSSEFGFRCLFTCIVHCSTSWATAPYILNFISKSKCLFCLFIIVLIF